MEENKIKGVTKHAIKQYIDRDRNGYMKVIETEILQRAKSGTEVFPINPVLKLMNHEYKKARYYKKKDIVFVVSEDNFVLTVLNYRANEFYKK